MSGFWRSVSSVFLGTLVAQSIPIAGSLIIARQYLPESFGKFSVWLGIVMFLAVVLTARFEAALALESDGEERQYAVAATLLMTLGLASVAALIVSCTAWFLPSWFGGLSSFAVLLLVPTAFGVAVAQVWQSWAAAEGTYSYLSLMRIVQATAVTLLQIAVGAVLPTADALAGAYFLGVIIAAIASVKLLPLKVRKNRHELLAASKSFWVRHIRFPKFSLPADAISSASAQLPVLLVAARFGAETAGYLAMAQRILGAPIALLGKAVLDVFKRRAAASFRERGECRSEYLQTFRVLSVGSACLCFGMYFLSERAFVLLLGAEWELAGTIAIWLTPLFALRFMASPLSYMVYIAGKQHLDLFWQVALVCTTYASLSLPSEYARALQLYSAAYSMLYLIYLFMSYRFSLGAKQ